MKQNVKIESADCRLVKLALSIVAVFLAGGFNITRIAPAVDQELAARTESYRGVLLSADAIKEATVKYWAEKDHCVVLFVTDVDAQQIEAARQIYKTQNQIEYFFEVARAPELARKRPQWMASLQGHDKWRRLFPDFKKTGSDEVVKCFPWVPVFNEEGFDAHLQRIGDALRRLPPAERIWLNNVQGAPSACGCGHPLCRWTADYGPIKTATAIGDSAPALFVKAVARLAPSSQIVPVMTSECEEDDKHTTCGGVNCFQGKCWKAFSRQLDAIAQVAQRIGVACFYREFDRDLPRYGETAAWTETALSSFEMMPPEAVVRVSKPADWSR